MDQGCHTTTFYQGGKALLITTSDILLTPIDEG